MSCVNARLEVGGDPPDSAEVLCAQLNHGFRLVAVFTEPPTDRASANLRLRQLAASFFEDPPEAPSVRAEAELSLIQRRLDDELYALAGRVSASGAFVVDLHSPITWGCSEAKMTDEAPEGWIETAEAIDLATSRGVDLSLISGLSELDQAALLEPFSREEKLRLERVALRLTGHSLRARRAHLLRALVLREVRGWARAPDSGGSLRKLVHGERLGYFARSFAGIYMLVVYFPGPFSELHVEAAALHALPLIERLVLSLPPIDPTPERGKVIRMPHR